MHKARKLKNESIKTENSTRTKEGDEAFDGWSKAYDEFRVIKPRRISNV